MGVDTYSFVSALNGILAQRLVRLTCTHCATADSPETSELMRSGLDPACAAQAKFTRGLGCAHCRGSGYKGRKAVAETLAMTDGLRDLLAERAPLSRIKAAARDTGYRSLREAALAAALAGQTTLEEVNRVTQMA
jgi:general secretion pathway protein E